MLNEFLPAPSVWKIINQTPPRISANENRCSSKLNADGTFSTKSAHLAIKQNLLLVNLILDGVAHLSPSSRSVVVAKKLCFILLLP